MASIKVSPPDAITDAVIIAPAVTKGSLSITAPCAIVVTEVQGPATLYPPRAAVEAALGPIAVAVAWPPTDPATVEAAIVAPGITLGRVKVNRPIAIAETGFSPPLVYEAWWDPEAAPTEATAVAPSVLYGSTVAVLLSPSEQRELLTNTTFEVDTSDWIGGGETSLSRSSDQQVDGGYSMYCEKDDEDIGAAYAYQYITTDIPSGTVVTWSVWVYPVTDCRIRMLTYDTTYGSQQEYWLVDGGAWTQLSITKTLGAGGSSRYVWVDARSNFYMDSAHLGAVYGAHAAAEAGIVAPTIIYGSVTVTPSDAATVEADIRSHELWPPWIAEGRGDAFSLTTGAA